MKYLEQREKIIQAYYNKKLNPYVCEACFCGNLLNNKNGWGFIRPGNLSGNQVLCYDKESLKLGEDVIKMESNQFYSNQNILDIENNFLKILYEGCGEDRKRHPNYEEVLFEAMDSTLDLLLEIHKANGDTSVLELEKPQFNKRNLQLI